MSYCRYLPCWQSQCMKECEGEFCAQHAGKKCCVCGEQAAHECNHTGQFVCGVPLCDDCEGYTDTSKPVGEWGFMNHTHRKRSKAGGTSMSKIHASPAPWRFAYTDNIEHPIILDAKGDVVCVMYEGVTTKDGRLMAAGPTLLEALKKLDAAYKRLKPSGYPESDAEKEARAAMDMALGELANG